jgi:hypothetical protein
MTRTDLATALSAGRIPPSRRSFAESLLASRTLSPKQAFWVDKLAREATAPAPVAAATELHVAGIVKMIRAAATALKYPKIRLHTERGEVIFSVAGARSRYCGQVMVVSEGGFGNNTFYGRIDQGGDWIPTAQGHAITPYVLAFSADPVGVAAAYGRRTGNCCFCARHLETPESLSVGYGPVCADHYGLPWGEVSELAA